MQNKAKAIEINLLTSPKNQDFEIAIFNKLAFWFARYPVQVHSMEEGILLQSLVNITISSATTITRCSQISLTL